jgi:transcription factor SFP1
MRDFACCGLTLPSLHDLLQHYEEAHAQQTPQSLRTASAAARARENSTPNSKAAIAAQASSAVQQQAQQQQNQPSRPQGLQMPQGGAPVGGIQLMRQQQQSQPSTPVPKHVQPVSEDMDGVEDMEMDDAIGPLDQAPETPVQTHQQPVQPIQQSMFGQQQRPNLNLNSNIAGLQHSGLRTSQPTTPATAGFGFQNNPTVSSVNTPTLSAQPIQQQAQYLSPDTSVPGTPAEMEDDDFSNMPLNMGLGQNMQFSNMNFPFGMGSDSLSLDLCIDEPAKRLYSPNGYNNQRLQQQFAQFGLGQGQFNNNNDLMLAYRQQQLMAMQQMGNPQAAAAMMIGEEHKPFKCPVIGCEKAYKNQNGLK